jgi:hypothetical protein
MQNKAEVKAINPAFELLTSPPADIHSPQFFHVMHTQDVDGCPCFARFPLNCCACLNIISSTAPQKIFSANNNPFL